MSNVQIARDSEKSKRRPEVTARWLKGKIETIAILSVKPLCSPW